MRHRGCWTRGAVSHHREAEILSLHLRHQPGREEPPERVADRRLVRPPGELPQEAGRPAGGGRLEVADRGDESRHQIVLGWWLAREPVDEIPERRDSQLLAPTQEPDVLEAGAPLAHEAQDLVAEALDARLEHPHPPVPE